MPPDAADCRAPTYLCAALGQIRLPHTERAHPHWHAPPRWRRVVRTLSCAAPSFAPVRIFLAFVAICDRWEAAQARLSSRTIANEPTGAKSGGWKSRVLQQRPAQRHQTSPSSRLVGPLPESQHPEPIWPHIKRPGHGTRGDPTRPSKPNRTQGFPQDRTRKVGVSSAPVLVPQSPLDLALSGNHPGTPGEFSARARRACGFEPSFHTPDEPSAHHTGVRTAEKFQILPDHACLSRQVDRLIPIASASIPSTPVPPLRSPVPLRGAISSPRLRSLLRSAVGTTRPLGSLPEPAESYPSATPRPRGLFIINHIRL